MGQSVATGYRHHWRLVEHVPRAQTPVPTPQTLIYIFRELARARRAGDATRG